MVEIDPDGRADGIERVNVALKEEQGRIITESCRGD